MKVSVQSVRVDAIDVDRYHREVGRIVLNERFVKMVADGFASRYKHRDEPGFTAVEADAREHGRGV